MLATFYKSAFMFPSPGGATVAIYFPVTPNDDQTHPYLMLCDFANLWDHPCNPQSLALTDKGSMLSANPTHYITALSLTPTRKHPGEW